MRSTRTLLVVILVLVLLTTGLWAFYRSSSAVSYAVPIFFSTFLGILTPLAVLVVRHQARRARIGVVDAFAESFKLDKDGRSDIASFEYVRGKYFAGVDLRHLPPGQPPTLADIPTFPMSLKNDWILFACAIPYMLISSFGVFLLFCPVSGFWQSGEAVGVATWLPPSILSAGGDAAPTTDGDPSVMSQHVNVLTVAALAFAGAYFFTIRLFLRAVAVFDLSALTFVRAFAHMVLAMTLAVVVYRALRHLPDLGGLLAGAGGATEAGGLGPLWLIVSFAMGFVPDNALNIVLQKSNLGSKGRYGELDRHCRTVPVTVIDGIDHEIAFRLEEAYIFDVQNLASANPIMMHVETPFNFYKVMDWIAEAQLCTAVGPERFLLLKTLNIRKIYDLELAAKSGDAALRSTIASILFRDFERARVMRQAFGLGEAVKVDPKDGGAVDIACMVDLMLDDLHVHRLRQICALLRSRLDIGLSDSQETRITQADVLNAENVVPMNRRPDPSTGNVDVTVGDLPVPGTDQAAGTALGGGQIGGQPDP